MSAQVQWNGEQVKAMTAAACRQIVVEATHLIGHEVRQILNRSIPSPFKQRAEDIDRTLAVEVHDSGNRGRIVADRPFARIQEFGGTIKARKGKFLTVPLSEEAKEASGRGLSAQQAFGDLEFQTDRNGNRYLVGLAGDKTHYILKTTDTLPAYPYMRPGFRNALPKIVPMAQAVFDATFGRAPGGAR